MNAICKIIAKLLVRIMTPICTSMRTIREIQLMVSSDFSSFVIERTHTTVGINLLNNFKCNVEISTKIFNGTAL